jgi:hypothetical protein
VGLTLNVAFWFQELIAKRFQRGFARVNLHRPTMALRASTAAWKMALKGSTPYTSRQWLTLIHLSPQREHSKV